VRRERNTPLGAILRCVELTLLGSAGYVPHGGRETCCALLREGGAGLLIDAGSGVRRLLDEPALLDGVTRLDVLLTHFHLDHTHGLFYLPVLPLPGRPAIFGPGAALYGRDTAAILAELLSSPRAPELREIGDAQEAAPPELHIAPFALRLRRQDRHAVPTLGVRLGESFAYCTDTAADPGTADFARGVSVLFHDVWSSAAAPMDVESHTTAAEAADIAAAAGVGRLVFIHRNPSLADDAPLLAEANRRFAGCAVGADGERFTF
jgi:ribonuclease BN (tRNA processing enzyme)